MKGTLTIIKIASCVIMMFLLAWLTVSAPFVYAGTQETRELAKKGCEKVGCNDAIPGSDEEKSESGINAFSEFLHDLSAQVHVPVLVVQYYKCHLSGLYFAFHPELVSPPPEV